MSALWPAAASFSARAHRHQIRKDGETPYAAHPARVAMLLATRFDCHDDVVLAAAYLHDTIEDCGVDYDELIERFGRTVADLVVVMTKDTRLVEPERETAYDAQLAAGPWQGRLLKIADVYDNLTDAATAASRRKLIGVAERALRIAAGDPELSDARRELAALVTSLSE